MLARNKRSRLKTRSVEVDVNPMSYMANLSDVMLVLAVGIMLALVMAWKLDLSHVGERVEISKDTEDLNISSNADGQSIEDYGLKEYGKVYMDKDGNYYIIAEEEE